MAVVHVWVGAVTSDSAWVRGKVSGSSVRLAYSTHADLSSPSYTTAAAPTLNIASHTATGLSADTQYYFALEVDGVLDTGFSGKFRTHGTVGQPYSFRFASSSCAGNSLASEDGDDGLAYITSRMSNRPIFDTIKDADPQFFIHLGDMHYEDITAGTNAAYRTAFDDLLTYNGTLSTTARQGRLYRNVPLVYMWDDHDYSDNDSDGSYTGKAAPAAVFRERVPHYPLAEANATYYEFRVGRVQFICTDSRYYRNFAGGTMLGSAQMTWLQNVLATSTAEFLIFCTQMQWHAGSSVESWPGYPTERATIAGWLTTYGWTDRMHMLTGDGHELGIDSGASNPYGGFPAHQLSALDSGGGVSGTDYDLVHAGGRDQYGIIQVQDEVSWISVTVIGYHGVTPLANHTVTVVLDTTAPSAPTALTVTDEGVSSISLSWAGSTDDIAVTGYRVFRDGAEVDTVASTSFTDSFLEPGSTYEYEVTAYDAVGNESDPSDSVEGITAEEDGVTPMAWPNTILGLYVEMNIGGTWTNITSDIYGHGRGSIEITRGSANESGGTLEPGRCSMTLNNRDGKYSPRNPSSSYYGLIGRNTPVRIWAPGPTAHLLMQDENAARGRIATTTSMDITTDLEVQVEMALDSIPQQDTSTYAPAQTEVIGRWTATSDQRSWSIVMGLEGRPILSWSPDGTLPSAISVNCPTHVPYSPGQRFALRATLDVNNGASGNTVTFYHAPTLAGTWVQLGAPVVTAGTTSVYNPTSPLDLGSIETRGFQKGSGRFYKAKVLNGLGGTVVVNADFTALSDGATGLTDAAGRTWTFSNCTITHLYQRFYGEVANWPVEWEVGGFDVWTQIEASGVLRRLSQGAKPIQSDLRRSIENQSPPPVGYWPIEDGVNSDSGGPGLDGIINMATSGWSFASESDVLGSKDLASLGSDATTMSGTTFGAQSGGFHFEFLYKLSALPATQKLFARFKIEGGDVARIDIKCDVGSVVILAYDDDGNNITNLQNTMSNATGLGLFTGQWNRFRLYSVNDAPSAGKFSVVATWETCASRLYWGTWNGTGITGTVGAPSNISATWGSDFNGMGIGHIAIWDGQINAICPPTDPNVDQDGYGPRAFNSASHGHSAERVNTRLGRLSQENQVRLVVAGDATATTQLGPQTPDAFLDNIQAAVDTDMGRLIELRHLPSLAYRSRYSLYNQPTTLSLDYAQSGQIVMPFAPIDDDQALRNDVTVTRQGGGDARSVKTTGPLSTVGPPDGVGVYDEQVTLNLYDDVQPKSWADWRLHLGTWDAARYPTLSFDLRVAPEKIEEWLNFEIGDIATVTNLPAWMPPDAILVRMEGYTETLNAFGWDVTMNCSPALPFRVGVVSDPILGHADTAGSELAVNASAELFEDATYNWTSADAGSAAWARSSTRAKDGTWSLKSGAITNSQSSIFAFVPPTGATRCSFWYYLSSEAVGTGFTGDYMAWYDGVTEMGRDTGIRDWTRVEFAVTSATQVAWSYVKDASTSVGEDGAWIDQVTFYFDGDSVNSTATSIQVVTTDGPLWTTDGANLPFPIRMDGEVMTVTAIGAASGELQTMTVTRSVNGVAKSHDNGAALSLDQPSRVALGY